MKRRLLNLLTALSLLLCAAAAALWVRGYSVSELVGVKAFETEAAAGSHKGRVFIGWHSNPGDEELDYGYAGRRSTADALLEYFVENAAWRFAGFTYTATKVYDNDLSPTRMVGTPAWFVLLLAAWLPAARACRWRRRHRRVRNQLCPQCGYDLRATPGRCPECGTPEKAPHETRLLNL